jgi:pyruvate-formate lyase-activating enzyme
MSNTQPKRRRRGREKVKREKRRRETKIERSKNRKGEKFIGEFKGGKINGQGTYIFPTGDMYVGEFKDGKKHGQGTFTWSGGRNYVGEWKDGKPIGLGTYTWTDGEKFVGEWKDDKRHGQGTLTFHDGTTYVGEFKNWKQHGQGTLTLPDGARYVGEWKNGVFHGQGTYTFYNGEKYEGEFKDGKTWNVKYYDQQGNNKKIMSNTQENKLCVYAWKGLQVSPNGDISMCCFQHGTSDGYLGGLQKDGERTIAEVRRSDKWNEIRQDMLDGKEHPACKKCWAIERDGFYSGRQYINDKYPESLEGIDSAELKDDVLHQIDIRQSNICNMKCLNCNSVYSSLWAIEEAQEHNLPATNGVKEIANDDIYNYLYSNIPHIKEFYFAGGEPLLNPVHWNIMKELDAIGRHDVKLVYNTNLLKLDYKGKHIFDYWDKFTNWHAGVSLDAIGDRAEYCRAGTKWPTMLKNLQLLKETYNKPGETRTFGIDCTVSALNVGGLIDFFEFLRQMNITNYRWLNYVYAPIHLHVSVLPLQYRHKMVSQVETYFEETDFSSITPIGEDGFTFFKNQMLNNEAATSKDKQDFKNFIIKKDKTRKTSIFDSCPEFKDIWDDIE